jgi:HlyD family secretion protein
MKLLRRIVPIVVVLGLLALIVIALIPSPIAVDVARVSRGQLMVTIDEEGEARAHDRFVVASPVAGRMRRVELHDGDAVKAGQVVAAITPLPLDERERTEALARVKAAEALRREADERVSRARADYEQARRERERAESLLESGIISKQSFEQARNLQTTLGNEVEAARFKAQAAAADVQAAKAALIAVDSRRREGEGVIELRSPVSGRVLRVVEKSERVVTAGAPLIILGDPERLEVVVDLLSTDAVKVRPGMTVLLENWGGEGTISARVRIVEASAFTKLSALGIEEQRVNVVADFVDTPGQLGDGYRVEARTILWEANDVLKIPASALFRSGEGWAVFALEQGRARKREVRIGHRSHFEVELLDGLEENTEIVIHPANMIQDGARVEAR